MHCALIIYSSCVLPPHSITNRKAVDQVVGCDCCLQGSSWSLLSSTPANEQMFETLGSTQSYMKQLVMHTDVLADSIAASHC